MPLAAKDILDVLLQSHDIIMVVLTSRILSEVKLADSGLNQFPRGVLRCDDGF